MMEQAEVEILIQTITAQYGTLNPGAILRTNAPFAAHLVDDCKCAVYRRPTAPASALLVTAPDLLPNLGSGDAAQDASAVKLEDADVQTPVRPEGDAAAEGAEGAEQQNDGASAEVAAIDPAPSGPDGTVAEPEKAVTKGKSQVKKA
jgi:hypothetical protein